MGEGLRRGRSRLRWRRGRRGGRRGVLNSNRNRQITHLAIFVQWIRSPKPIQAQIVHRLTPSLPPEILHFTTITLNQSLPNQSALSLPPPLPTPPPSPVCNISSNITPLNPLIQTDHQ